MTLTAEEERVDWWWRQRSWRHWLSNTGSTAWTSGRKSSVIIDITKRVGLNNHFDDVVNACDTDSACIEIHTWRREWRTCTLL